MKNFWKILEFIIWVVVAVLTWIYTDIMSTILVCALVFLLSLGDIHCKNVYFLLIKGIFYHLNSEENEIVVKRIYGHQKE